MAFSRFDTSYAAAAASRIWKNVTPFAVTVALSRVITSWCGTSSTCSITFSRLPMPSMNGMIRLSPGLSVRV